MRWIVLVLALLLAGCTQIPSTGPVQEVQIPADAPGIEIAPQPPQDAAEPNRILEGFLLAMADPESDYAVAREYLTYEAAKDWVPQIGTVVYSGSIVENAGSYSVQGEQIGSLDDRGRFTAGGGTLEHDFGLVEVDGQWRIGNPPEGIIVNRYLFERFYSPLTIYFMGRSGAHVVPDLITMPESMVTPAAIVQAQLEGPSRELIGAVTNAMPAGAQLGPGGATIDAEGVVTVDFTGISPSLGEEGRRRLGVQLLWSMTAIPRASGLRITLGGQPLALPGEGVDGVLELTSQQGYQVLARPASQDLFAVRDQVAGRIVAMRGFEPFPQELPPVAEMAVSLDGRSVAAVSAERNLLYIGPREGELRPVEGFTGIRDAQFVLDSLFAVVDDAEGKPQVISVEPDGTVQTTAIELPEGMSLRSLAISQYGVSAAVLTESAEGTKLGRMTLFQGDRLDGWQEVPIMTQGGARLARIADVRWNSESTLIVAGEAAGEPDTFIVRADGSQVEELGSVVAEVAEVAVLPRPGGGLLALRTSDGRVWRYSSPTRWTELDFTADSITYAG